MNISSKMTGISVKFKAMTAAIVVSMPGDGVAQANIIEDIYTGNSNFSSTTSTEMFEYDDQVGSVSQLK